MATVGVEGLISPDQPTTADILDESETFVFKTPDVLNVRTSCHCHLIFIAVAEKDYCKT